jgi:2-haloacid dehalogenase
MPISAAQRRIVVFDLGGVLLQWDPRHLYRKLFADEAAMESFLADVCTVEWNERQDAEGTVEILRELKARGTPLYALTNWSAETYPPQRVRFAFLELFDGVVVSGDEGVIKPDARIFEILLARYAIPPHEAVFIDDNPANAEAAAALGIHGIHFQSPEQLRRDLRALQLL